MVDPAMLLASARTELARLPRILDGLLGDLDAATWRERPAPAEWSPVEIVCRDADPSTALTTFGERRAASLAFLAGVPPEVLRHAVTHPRLGTLSGLDLLAAWVTHDRLHLAQLAATLARLGARRWTPLRAEYAGPIPYRESPVQ